MMRVAGRMERLGDHIFFLGRVIVGKVGANPKYIRDVIAMLGLEDSRPVTTPSVKRKPTTESMVELENEKRAVYRTGVGADIMYSVKETARKILCPTESEENRTILERCPKCKVFDRVQHIPAVRERVH